MNKKQFLLDTNFLIGFLRGKENYISKFEEIAESRLYISSITITEIYAGCRKNEESITGVLIDKLLTIKINKSIAKLAGELKYKLSKSGKTIHVEDAIIGATAKLYNLTLITQNIKDFPMLSSNQIEQFPCHR